MRAKKIARAPPYCKVSRPDVVPPAAPVIRDYEQVPTGVRFTFTPSSSTDVVCYKFQRRKKQYVQWEDLATYDPATTLPEKFTDSTAFKKYTFEYRLVAYDEAGLGGASNIITVKPKDNGLRPPILDLAYTLVGNPPAAVLLSWAYPQYADPDLMGFQVQRAVGGDPMRNLLFLTVQQVLVDNSNPPGKCNWTDPDAAHFKGLTLSGLVNPVNSVPGLVGGANGVAVRYAIYAKYIDGTLSPLANITVAW